MLKMIAVTAALFTFASATPAFADQPPANPAKPASSTGQKPQGACETIEAACRGAGFVEGDYQKGYGLWKDCIDPIMQGAKQPAKAIKPLPSVQPATVAACKQKNPKFGEQKPPAK